MVRTGGLNSSSLKDSMPDTPEPRAAGEEDFDRPCYPMPEGMDTHETLKYIFKHCCTFGRTSADGTEANSIDNANFMKMVKKAPGLLTKRVTTQHVDVVFTKCKPRYGRRLNYARFLDALSQLGGIRYPDEDPVNSFAYLLTGHIFGLLASDATQDGANTLLTVKEELLSPPRLSHEEYAQALHAAQEETQALAYSAAGSVRWDLQEELDDETRTRKVKELQKKRTQGKILVAKQKWDEKKKSKGI
eukprot:FR737390.1.p1 GENE.FR737390.1~~FR737390.1.p1  ORF type:complete len:246 (+),score=32.52 FR737390.1:1-738(+)